MTSSDTSESFRLAFVASRFLCRSAASSVIRITAHRVAIIVLAVLVSRTHATRLRSALLNSRTATQKVFASEFHSAGRGSPALSLKKGTRRSATGSFCVHVSVVSSCIIITPNSVTQAPTRISRRGHSFIIGHSRFFSRRFSHDFQGAPKKRLPRRPH